MNVDHDTGKKEYLEITNGKNGGKPLPKNCGKGCEDSVYSKASQVCLSFVVFV